MKLDLSHAKSLLDRIRGLKVAVLGDLMLDEYLFGEVSRISPEAPVPIVRIVREKAVLGGAANVAANLRALGAEPLLIGTLQKDVAGERLMELLARSGISSEGLVVDPSRPTIIKTRVIGQTQQMLRIDRPRRAARGCATVDAAPRARPAPVVRSAETRLPLPPVHPATGAQAHPHSTAIRRDGEKTASAK